MFTERRAHPRHPCLQRVVLRVGDRPMQATLVDLSASGAFVATRETAEAGPASEVLLLVRAPGDTAFSVQVKARVMRQVQPGLGPQPGLGLSFLEARCPSSKDSLLRFLRGELGLTVPSGEDLDPYRFRRMLAVSAESATLPVGRPGIRSSSPPLDLPDAPRPAARPATRSSRPASGRFAAVPGGRPARGPSAPYSATRANDSRPVLAPRKRRSGLQPAAPHAQQPREATQVLGSATARRASASDTPRRAPTPAAMRPAPPQASRPEATALEDPASRASRRASGATRRASGTKPARPVSGATRRASGAQPARPVSGATRRASGAQPARPATGPTRAAPEREADGARRRSSRELRAALFDGPSAGPASAAAQPRRPSGVRANPHQLAAARLAAARRQSGDHAPGTAQSRAAELFGGSATPGPAHPRRPSGSDAGPKKPLLRRLLSSTSKLLGGKGDEGVLGAKATSPDGRFYTAGTGEVPDAVDQDTIFRITGRDQVPVAPEGPVVDLESVPFLGGALREVTSPVSVEIQERLVAAELRFVSRDRIVVVGRGTTPTVGEPMWLHLPLRDEGSWRTVFLLGGLRQDAVAVAEGWCAEFVISKVNAPDAPGAFERYARA